MSIFTASLESLQRDSTQHISSSYEANGPYRVQAIMQRVPAQPPGGQHVLFEHFWVGVGPLPLPDPDAPPPEGRFVMTPSVSMHLRNLARAVLLRRYPILLQVMVVVSCAYACLHASIVCPSQPVYLLPCKHCSFFCSLSEQGPHLNPVLQNEQCVC